MAMWWCLSCFCICAADPTIIQNGPKEFSVQFADGVRIELEGVNSADATLPVIWQPNGEIKVRPEDWPPLLSFPDQNPTHGFVFKLSGLQRGQQAVWRLPGQWATPAWPDQGLVRPAISTRVPLQPGDPEPEPFDIQIGITAADWGPMQLLSAEGVLQPLEQPIPEEFRSAYERVKIKVLDQGDQIGLEFQGIRGVDDFTQHQAVMELIDGTFVAAWATTLSAEGHRVELFKVTKADVDVIGYRLRPYVQWVTFRNVSLHPGTITECLPEVRRANNPEQVPTR